MQDFRKLRVWEQSHDLVLRVYRASHGFPKREMYGVTGQMRRAAASVPANIAEGCGRRSNAELAQYLSIAMGSATELQYHLLLARDLALLVPEEYAVLDSRVAEVQMMLAALIRRLTGARVRA
jgi:four helix bundle protein